MRRTLFKSKIHRATVTQADLDYEGSVTIDAELMRAADILPYEKVHIWNRTNGSRLETYALEAPAGSGVICVNGAAAHHAQSRRHRHHRDVRRGERRRRGARRGSRSSFTSTRRTASCRWRASRTRFRARSGGCARSDRVDRNSVSRVETLKKFIAAHPADPFPRYGLAQEYKNAGQLAEARAEFAALMRDHPDYTAGVSARGQRAARARRAGRGARDLRTRHRGLPAPRRRSRDERARRRAVVVRRVDRDART